LPVKDEMRRFIHEAEDLVVFTPDFYKREEITVQRTFGIYWDQYAWGIRRPPASISPTIHEKVRKRSFTTIALFMVVHRVDWPADSL
jgi:hypothetical protein